MSILIGADFVPTQSNMDNFISSNMKPILGDSLMDILSQADYRIVNLEMPLVNSPAPIKKNGSALCGKTQAINGYKSLNIDLVTLANNHIMDQGKVGLQSTLNTLNLGKIAYLGVGNNLKEASKPYLFECSGKKIGVYACVEHEFSCAEETAPGANPFDPLESFDHVVELKKECEFLIVLYHGGKEYYRYPSPMLQRVCRKFVEKGASLVVCQHSHCIGCEEKYLSGTVVYGQGNFLFNSCDGSTEQTSLLLKITDSFDIEYIPLEKFGNGVRLARGDSARNIIEEFYERSRKIRECGFIETAYTEFAKENLKAYILASSGYSHKFFKRVLNRLFGSRLTKWFAKKAYTQHELLVIQNYIDCEAHRELFLTGLKNVLK